MVEELRTRRNVGPRSYPLTRAAKKEEMLSPILPPAMDASDDVIDLTLDD